MPQLLTCPQGHQWEAPEATPGTTCPVCGAAASAVQPNTADYFMQVSTAARGVGASTDGAKAVAGPGQQRGRFVIVRPHARGGLGQVSLARDEKLRRQVALKEIRTDRLGDPGLRQRFVTEAEITGQLEHPGIVPIYALDDDEQGQPYYAMRFIQGLTLAEAIQSHHRQPTPLGFRDLLKRFVDVCQTVAYAHSKGVIHRDLKPANIMLGDYGETLVLDWGLAKRTSEPRASARGEGAGADHYLTVAAQTEEGLTGAGQVLGTPAYMSPEQAEGRADEIGQATDIYALGAILYEILTGQPPYRGSTKEVLEQVRRKLPAPPVQVNWRTPRALEAICLLAMARTPAQRYPTTAALAQEIERWLADEPVAAYREPWTVQAQRWARKRRTLVTSLLATLLVALAASSVGLGLLANEQASTARERDDKEKARAEASANADRTEQARKQTRRALNKMTDRVVRKLFARRPMLSADEREFLKEIEGFYAEFAKAGGETPDALLSQANGHDRVAVLCHRLGRLADAEVACNAALAILNRLIVEYPHEPVYRVETVDALLNLGNVYHDQARWAETERVRRRTIDLCRELAASDPNNQPYQSMLATAWSNIGTLFQATQQAEQALTAHDQALSLRRKLVETAPHVSQYWDDVAKSHRNRMVLFREAERLVDWEREVLPWRSITTKLADRFPHEPDHRLDLALAENELGIIYHKTSRTNEAERAYRNALAIHRKLVADFPGIPDHHNGVAGSLGNLALFANQKGNLKQARQLLDEAMPHHRAALLAVPKHSVYREYFRNNLGGLCGVLAKLGEHPAAVEHCAVLIREFGSDRIARYDAACAWSLCAMAAEKDPKLSAAERKERGEVYRGRAMVELRKALELGYRDVAHMKKDSDLDPLRDREDFNKLLAGLEAGKQTNPK